MMIESCENLNLKEVVAQLERGMVALERELNGIVRPEGVDGPGELEPRRAIVDDVAGATDVISRVLSRLADLTKDALRLREAVIGRAAAPR